MITDSNAIIAIIPSTMMVIVRRRNVELATPMSAIIAIPHSTVNWIGMVKFIVLIAITMLIHRAIVFLELEGIVILVTHILSAPLVEQIRTMNGMMMRNVRNITALVIASIVLIMMVIVVIILVRIVVLNAAIAVHQPSAIMAQVVLTNLKEIAGSVIVMIHTSLIALIVVIVKTLKGRMATVITGATMRTAILPITFNNYSPS